MSTRTGAVVAEPIAKREDAGGFAPSAEKTMVARPRVDRAPPQPGPMQAPASRVKRPMKLWVLLFWFVIALAVAALYWWLLP